MHEKNWNPFSNAEPIGPWSENDPTMVREWSDHGPKMIQPHNKPSRTRRTAKVDHSRSGTYFCEKKDFMHLLCLKKAFRGRLPSKLHRKLVHQHHVQSHWHCGNDFTLINHNGILSTRHARKIIETPFTMRNRSEQGPKMIQEWSDEHTRPSRTRRTAEADLRRSGTHFVWNTHNFVHLVSLKNTHVSKFIYQHHLLY